MFHSKWALFSNPITYYDRSIGSLNWPLPLPHPQYSEVKVEYPDWANFVGAVIVLSSILWIPGFLIGRLILLDSARQQAKDFLREKLTQFEGAYAQSRDFVKSVPHHIRSVCSRRGQQGSSWELFSNAQNGTYSLADNE